MAGRRQEYDRVVIALDVDAFYPQAEVLRNPSLRGKAVGVRQKHMVVSASYEARASGVAKGDSVETARRKCPSMVLVNGEDLAYYSELSDRLRRFVEARTGAAVERLGLDELFVEASDAVDDEAAGNFVGHVVDDGDLDAGHRRKLAAGSRYAAELRQAIFDELGLTTSAGISSNKLLAKMVSSRHKPFDQTTLVPGASAVLHALPDDLPLSKVPGVGRATVRALGGLSTVGDVRRKGAPPRVARLCAGIDESPVQVSGRPQTVGVEDSYWRSPVLGAQAATVVEGLCAKLVAKLAADRRGAEAEGRRRPRPSSLVVSVAKRVQDASSGRRTKRAKYEGPAPLDSGFEAYAKRTAARLLGCLVADDDRLHIIGISLVFQSPEASRGLEDWLASKPPRPTPPPGAFVAPRADEVDAAVLAALPDDVRAEVSRQMALARRCRKRPLAS